ncbi:hypothetical protein KC960_04505 [Candidatus Saccharibacteria bacterium]|nr:hypothetical protein [Candidatus Saccharibacteria bacterium]
MKVFNTKVSPYSGTDFSELNFQARKLYNFIKGQTKRQPYIRSRFSATKRRFLSNYSGYI